jgi:hypothetical protein
MFPGSTTTPNQPTLLPRRPIHQQSHADDECHQHGYRQDQRGWVVEQAIDEKHAQDARQSQ